MEIKSKYNPLITYIEDNLENLFTLDMFSLLSSVIGKIILCNFLFILRYSFVVVFTDFKLFPQYKA